MNKIADKFKKIIITNFGSEKISTKFLQRIDKGNLTKDENPESHFCVYFAAYDPKEKQFFLGHHKKSGLWLFNGGHIDKGELPEKSLEREIEEEWGIKIQMNSANPSLLTITKINNPTKQTCKTHYDIWYFIPVNKKEFFPSKENLAEEFYDNKWMTSNKTKRVVTENNTITAIKFLEENVF